MKSRMRTKILLLCLCSTLAALIVQTFLFQRASSALLYEQTERAGYRSLENMLNEMTSFFKKIEGGLIKIYNDREFLQDLSTGMSAEELHSKYYQYAYTIGTENFSTSDKVMAVYIYNARHEIISTYRKAATPKHNYPRDIYEDEIYNGEKIKEYIASSENDMIISSYYNPYREKNIVRFAVKIYNNTKLNDKIGYIVCDIDSSALQKIMEKYVIDDQMYIWLQPVGDRQIYAIGNLGEESLSYYEKIDDCICRGALEELENISVENEVLFRVSQEDYNLDVYSITPQEMLRRNQEMLTRNLILIAAIMIVLITAITSYITKSLAKPLEELANTMSQVRSGHMHNRVTYRSEDEIGQLGEEFNRMLDEIERLITKVYEDQQLINTAEYKALQAQINPHFLYNTLDTMSSIASIQDCEIVSSLCQSLSGIFRYSLDMKHPYSTVMKEIEHLKNYVFVMNVRMRDEVKYNFHIEEAVLQDSIPRISIQPLVENALKHGLKNKHGKKTVEVRAEDKDKILQICVIDNGVGMDSGEINRKLKENDRGIVESGDSIGIFNINARLKLLYGEEYGVYVESAIGEGTCVTIRIPRMKMEEVETWKR